MKAYKANEMLVAMMGEYDDDIGEAMLFNGITMLSELGEKIPKLTAREYFDRVTSRVFPVAYKRINYGHK